MTKVKTAILLFSRTARSESVNKKWSKNTRLNFRIADKLIENTRSRLSDAPFPFFQVDESKQIGSSYHEKLSSAFEQTFALGYQNVIAVGNDCESLDLDWFTIEKQLKQEKVVLGPDRRGGVFLIALTSRTDCKLLFQQVSWKSARVFEQLKTLFVDYYVLNSRKDINTFEELFSISGIKQFIRRVLELTFTIISKTYLPSKKHKSTLSLRAPPIPQF